VSDVLLIHAGIADSRMEDVPDIHAIADRLAAEIP